MTDRIPQIGETIRNPLGSNLKPSFAIMQEIRTKIEEITETTRIQAILQQHLDGKVSALAVKYSDIVKCPEILNFVTPISREPDIDGKIILWEGHQRDAGDFTSGMRGERGPRHRVIQHANGHRTFCKYNSVLDCWTICEATDPVTKKKIPNRFPALGFARRKNKDWDDITPNTMQRTVMNPKGDTVTRSFNGYVPKTARR